MNTIEQLKTLALLAPLALSACGDGDTPRTEEAPLAPPVAPQSTGPAAPATPAEPATPAPPPPPPRTGPPPVEIHGQLSVSGTNLVDANGTPIQLKGMSTMWLNWDPKNYGTSKHGLQWMRDRWGLEIIRAAMGVEPGGAYLSNRDKALGQVRQIIDNAIELGVYVLVDWHDHEALNHRQEAEDFFAMIASEYGDTPNILYEVFNEPLDVDWSQQLKPYHEALVSRIRSVDQDGIVILGTPNWSQDVDLAAADPVAGTNLMYTLHFYSCTHNQRLRAKARGAITQGLPLFVTEWGATHADGGLDGIVCEEEAQKWHDFMTDNLISWTAWKLDGCNHSSCMFANQSVSPTEDWAPNLLAGHGQFVVSRMQE